jgi:hypothetical protein
VPFYAASSCTSKLHARIVVIDWVNSLLATVDRTGYAGSR